VGRPDGAVEFYELDEAGDLVISSDGLALHHVEYPVFEDLPRSKVSPGVSWSCEIAD
jgi:hypothetical protein